MTVAHDVPAVRAPSLAAALGTLYSIAAGKPTEFLTCERCQALETVEPRRLDGVRELIAEEFGYDAGFTHFPIVGTCAECQSLPDEEPVHHAHP